MKLVILTILAFACVVTPASASSDWYWSPERAEYALESFEPDVDASDDGADCVGVGRRIRSDRNGRKLYKRFACDVWDDYGDYLGDGRLYVRGSGLGRYRWRWSG